jgi:glycosyltransferase involved in cell wall biosynthesis
MSSPDEPLVSVVTPFYNTADYLPECIESVLEQSYGNWEYILVNNFSTDGSAAIARRYAEKDARIRVLDNAAFLTQIDNYNHALRQPAPASRYCKMVEADNWIFPECLARMVASAEANPRVGVVASYHRTEDVLQGVAPCGASVFPGRQACRSYFLDDLCVFGPPTTVLFRTDVVRAHDPFFNGALLHPDTDALFRTLRDWDLGFVHQVLSFVRTYNESITAGRRPFHQYRLDRFMRSRLYADQCLAPEEAREVKDAFEREYLRFLASRTLAGRKFWQYHRHGLASVHYTIPRWKFARALLWEFIDRVGNPKRTAAPLFGRLKRLWRRPSPAPAPVGPRGAPALS